MSRIGSGSVQTSWVGSGQMSSNLAGRVRSGQVGSRASGRVGSGRVVKVVVNQTFFLRFEEISRIPAFFFAFRRIFSAPAKYLKDNFPYVSRKSPASSQNIGQAHGVSRVHRVATWHCTRYRIDQSHPQGHAQAVAGRRKRRAQRELYASSRQSRFTDMADIHTKSPSTFISWRALSL